MATLTKEILDKLKVGNASLRFIEQVGKLTDGLFADANEIFTLENTLSIDQGEPSKTELKIDQSDVAVGVHYESGEFTIKGTVPSVATELLDEFFEKNGIDPTLTGGIVGGDGKTKYTVANGYALTSKRKKVTMMVESGDRKLAIVFMNVEIVASFKWGSVKTDPIGIEITGTVLANNTKDADDFYVIETA